MFSEADGVTPPLQIDPESGPLNSTIKDWWAKQEFPVVISDSMARRFFPGEDPIGKRFATGLDSPSPRAVIVGVVGDTRQNTLEEEPAPVFYFSSFQMPDDNLWLVARGVNAASLVPAIRGAITEVDKEALVTNATTMERLVSGAVSGRRTNVLLLGAFAALALVLASIGVYGVMAFLVAQRTREIGVRVALGAKQADVLKLVVGYGAKLTLAGLVIGLAAAGALTRVISSMLYGVTALDTATLAATAVVLLTCGLAASYLPARRAMRIDPAVTLRAE
jgi:putative ABC transport system permease protein